MTNYRSRLPDPSQFFQPECLTLAGQKPLKQRTEQLDWRTKDTHKLLGLQL